MKRRLFDSYGDNSYFSMEGLFGIGCISVLTLCIHLEPIPAILIIGAVRYALTGAM